MMGGCTFIRDSYVNLRRVHYGVDGKEYNARQVILNRLKRLLRLIEL